MALTRLLYRYESEDARRRHDSIDLLDRARRLIEAAVHAKPHAAEILLRRALAALDEARRG